MDIDGLVVDKTGSSIKVKSHDIVEDLRAREINSIHNHPVDYPPSNNDIFNFLYSGNHKRYAVVTSAGTMYDLRRTPKTASLTWISKDNLRKTDRKDITPSMINEINRDYRGNRIRFGKFYNSLCRAHAERMGITTQKELNENSVKIQEKILFSLAEHYKFDVHIEKER